MRLLIVEDDPFIALDLSDQLAKAGFTVIGSASNVAEALDILSKQDCDVALVDIHLAKETSEQVALTLIARKIPFITLTGYSAPQRGSGFQSAPILHKPVEMTLLIAELRRYGSRH